jgi:SHS2 domain-containing protein
VTRYQLPQPYEELDHTADVGIIVRGATADETLGRLVLGLADLVSGGAPVREERELRVRAEPSDRAAMAVDVLREVLFRFDSEQVIPASCETLVFDPERGAEVLLGVGPYDPEAHAEGIDLKAVTLHEARFEPEGQGYVAQIVFDI